MAGKTGNGEGGIFEGISSFVEKLSKLAEKAESLKKSGEFTSPGKKVKGAYDLDIRVGAGPEKGRAEVEPVEKGHEKQRPEVQPIREPLVDVFDEEAGLLVVAQVPGVPCREIILELTGDILTVRADHDSLKYYKEVLLPRSYSKDRLHASCHNGIVEIRLSGPNGEAT